MRRHTRPVRSSSSERHNYTPSHSRAAIVIGNGGYAEGKLANPTKDAGAIDKKRRELGFETIFRTEVDRKGLFEALGEFRDTFGSASVGLMFYAGHGVQSAGKNYMVPSKRSSGD
jgi:uncharacterized caspase-like protein